MTAPTRACPFPHGFDFTDPDLIERGMPISEFAELRRTAPVWWNAQEPGTGGGFHDGGYWVISKHAHIREISKNSGLWSTNANGAIIRLPEYVTPDQIEFTKALLINHDPPEHTRLRKIVSRIFTPRAVNSLHDRLRDSAARIVTEAAEKGAGNFVDDVAIHLPLQAILDLIGVPEPDRPRIHELVDAIINSDDPDQAIDPTTANAELLGYAYAMAEDRRANPTDDVTTTLVQADIDGESLSEIEFGFFVILLITAGNETTRNATTHGMNAFFDRPDQWELYKRERPATAVDEILRWATPVHAFQRTALSDTVVGDVEITRGQRVGLFYSSANYDEDVFDDPFTFDISRDPNPHLAFGGNGAHFCIGANLARLELKLIFDAIADNLPDISRVSEMRRVRSGWLNGVKELGVRY
ncbi:cytochrome P450 [Gordonia bronchialis DSM 43247]|uniref:Cytochrome P450 n=1 Tax=Gordonia bronchialis (strain ATCC 25592 / DSM 43247 / BCRC 13721 / JCM 3198 / KCTC 3076 / NBRC 16047 / NCTC 10667) TaxID=526226 RepID=D0L3Z5_GORB4|nr:cytochrome P450 [Gordonia bronchialis]ACY23148.1 cytochrome P450 [Gordonia bronchialis DSM 43247]MCC3325929.1 cytochrome P450 [Gordonia bronchialis]QGS23447.1 cytochrome P450 [Gordonia bronchialis]STQ66105.1 Steroid C27-monooxygenase [Gordonia bronchialis]